MAPRNIHLAIYEFSLLSSIVNVVEAYDAILKAHTEPAVIALFTDLKNDWYKRPSQYPDPMIKPFVDRETESSDFLIASSFARVGSLTSGAEIYWGGMAVAFLLKKKLMVSEPEAEEVLLCKNFSLGLTNRSGKQ